MQKAKGLNGNSENWHQSKEEASVEKRSKKISPQHGRKGREIYVRGALGVARTRARRVEQIV